ncbi:MAG TPA: sulfur reduction protein DsrE [Marinobacter sp.]|uniref:Sulfur reduction protein DsrE n=2 Tax=root TaxID=1 RepID=A0A831VWY5_9GAMM|nr:DsrE family protein [Marinobacter antarcticus]HDZ39202.1 sulfur reduction protein DsrE [Marinobacter sp.]HEA51301.1 sulfur reduction protein DsrE [Marinobacter antarcticus]
MKKLIYAMAMLLALTVAPITAGAAGSTSNPDWQYPEIENFGRIQPLPDAVNQPALDQTHKAAFSVTRKAKDRGQPNPDLERVARAVNLFASAGVPQAKRDFVAVIYGPATPSVLNDAQYNKRFGQKNPNRELIAALRNAGVKVHVCGQALAGHGFDQAWVDPNVDIALSALSDLVIYGNRGYALIP